MRIKPGMMPTLIGAASGAFEFRVRAAAFTVISPTSIRAKGKEAFGSGGRWVRRQGS
jgi:hypothetical protein